MLRQLLRSFGYGIVLYACMYLAWALLATYGLAGGSVARFFLLAVLLATTLIAARSLGMHSARDVLPYSISWVVTIAAIDTAFAAPSGSWALFADPNLWVGYCLLLIAPLLVPRRLPGHVPDIT